MISTVKRVSQGNISALNKTYRKGLNMNKKYFENLFRECETGEEVKSLYKRLAMKYHPDKGGDNESMKALNLAFEDAFERLKNIHRNHETKEKYTKQTYEYAREFIDLINALFKFKDITIELIGSFVWVSGETKAIKEDLKALGLRFSGNKKAWYKAPAGYRKSTNARFTMDDIRSFYGSTVVQKSEDEDVKQGRLALN